LTGKKSTGEDHMARRLLSTIIASLAAILFAAHSADAQTPEITKVRLAVGGKTSLYYLPLTVTERLGYFKDAGLDVEISDLQGGSKSLQALVGGSADVVTGAFDHTIQMQAKKQAIVAIVQLGRFPGFVLALRLEKAAAYTGPKDLKGLKIGVTAPGSSTHFMALHMMVQNGLQPADASFIGIGNGSTAFAAIQRGDIDAIVNSDPAIALLESQKLIKIVADTRTLEGTKAVYGGPYPAAVLYASPAFIEKNPRTIQALANAFVRGLKWMQTRSAEDIAKVMPEEYALGNMPIYIQSIRTNLPLYSPDGRLSREAAETALTVLREFDPAVKDAKIDLAATYTNAFVDEAQGASH
jgi:NitT/TauT family transport system substrate-binding protein